MHQTDQRSLATRFPTNQCEMYYACTRSAAESTNCDRTAQIRQRGYRHAKAHRTCSVFLRVSRVPWKLGSGPLLIRLRDLLTMTGVSQILVGEVPVERGTQGCLAGHGWRR